jgi:hypothetical protein
MPLGGTQKGKQFQRKGAKRLRRIAKKRKGGYNLSSIFEAVTEHTEANSKPV